MLQWRLIYIEYKGIKVHQTVKRAVSTRPGWQQGIESKMRKSLLTKICEWERGNSSKKLKKEIKYLRSVDINTPNPNFKEELEIQKDKLKQTISMLPKRLDRFNKSYKRKNHWLFYKNGGKFCKIWSASSRNTQRAKPARNLGSNITRRAWET